MRAVSLIALAASSLSSLATAARIAPESAQQMFKEWAVMHGKNYADDVEVCMETLACHLRYFHDPKCDYSIQYFRDFHEFLCLTFSVLSCPFFFELSGRSPLPDLLGQPELCAPAQ